MLLRGRTEQLPFSLSLHLSQSEVSFVSLSMLLEIQHPMGKKTSHYIFSILTGECDCPSLKLFCLTTKNQHIT